MATRLTPYEKETIILTNEGDTEFTFDTFNEKYKRKLAALCENYPAYCRVKRDRSDGSISYFISKECISIHFTAQYSGERRQKSREQAKKNGLTGSNGKRAS